MTTTSPDEYALHAYVDGRLAAEQQWQPGCRRIARRPRAWLAGSAMPKRYVPRMQAWRRS